MGNTLKLWETKQAHTSNRFTAGPIATILKKKHTRLVTDMLNSHKHQHMTLRHLKGARALLTFSNFSVFHFMIKHSWCLRIGGQTVKLTLHNSRRMTRTSWYVPSDRKLSRIYTLTTGTLGLNDILKHYCVQCWSSAAWLLWRTPEKKAENEELSRPHLSRLRSAHCGGQNIRFS